MQALMIIIGILLIGVVAAFGYILWKLDKKLKASESPAEDTLSGEVRDQLAELVQIMREDREMIMMERRDQELKQYAKNRYNTGTMGDGGIISNVGEGERPVRTKTGGDLVPFGMNDRDRSIIEQFYGS